LRIPLAWAGWHNSDVVRESSTCESSSFGKSSSEVGAIHLAGSRIQEGQIRFLF
jgi:hypothetical protein